MRSLRPKEAYVTRMWSSALLGDKAKATATSTATRRLRFDDYLEAPLHHPWWLLVPFVLVVAAATAAAFLLPKRYVSSCLVVIKASGVPEKIIANVADELDARRHQTIRQEILSRSRLEKVNEELQPYPDAPTVSAAVERLQNVVQVNFKGRDAFSIEFSHRDPRMAQGVTDRVASLFIDEFRRSRQTQVEGAADFLDTELQDAQRQLNTKEEALRRYKEANMGRLPEQLQATLSTLQRLQLEIQALDQSLDAAEGRLERLTARDAGPESTASSPSTGPTEREALELELARLRQRYTDEHPDVKALAARLRAMAPVSPAPAADTDYSSAAMAQIERARADVSDLVARRQRLRGQVEAMQARVEQMPRTEQELATLTRDFNQLRENYQTLLRKKMEAQTAERLQRRWTEDFEILDRAQVPEQHASPNRRLFVLAGIVLGLCIGIGAAVLAEIFSPYVLSLDDLESTVPLPVLAVLPLVAAAEAAAAARDLEAGHAKSRSRPSGHLRS